MASLKQPYNQTLPGGGPLTGAKGGAFTPNVAQPVPPDNMWTNGYDPAAPWTAPLGGPAPEGYEQVGNQWSKVMPELFPGDAGYQTPAPEPGQAGPAAGPQPPQDGSYQPPSEWAAPQGGGGGGADPNVDPFAASGGGIYADGGWKPLSMVGGGPGGGQQGGAPVGLTSTQSGSMGASRAPAGGMQSLYDKIDQLLSTDGQYNQGLVNQRVGAARDTLETQRSAELDTLRGLLADRGLLGDGAELESYGNMGARLGTAYGQQVSDILGEESNNADSRLLGAIASATGLSTADANRLIADYEAQTGRQVGMGQIDAQNRQTAAQEAQNVGMLGLNQDRLSLDAYEGQSDRDLAFYQWYFGPNGPGAQTSEGYV